METEEPGDPRRTIELLWGVPGPPRRGPKPKLSVEHVVFAGIRVADAEGLDAVTMRRIADELGVATMSLYTYVPGRDELLELMLDHAHGELPGELPEGWRAGLTAVAEDLWRLYHRHPWLLEIRVGRPTLGPHTFAKYERELAAMDGLDLDDVREHMLSVDHVQEVHDLHASMIGTGMPVISAHVVIDDECFESGHAPEILEQIRACMREHFPVSFDHATIQLETAAVRDRTCEDMQHT